MMIRLTHFFIVVLALFPVAQSTHASELWITVSRHGLDGQGRSGAETYEIFPDRRAVWETSSFGQRVAAGCAAGGGRFEKKLESPVVAQIGALARAAVRSQKKPPKGKRPVPPRARSLRWSVSVSDGKTDERSGISDSTPEWDALLKRLHALRSELNPVAAVSMRATLKGKNALVARFTSPDAGVVELMLPDHASEAFSIPGFKVTYASRPKGDSIVLDGANRSGEVRLKMEPVPGVAAEKVLRYSNALIRHHQENDPLAGGRGAPALNLCASIRK